MAKLQAEVNEFVRIDLGYPNPAEAPVRRRSKATRAARLDALSEFYAETKPERADKLAARAEAIRAELLAEVAEENRRAPRVESGVQRPAGEARHESDREFIRRRLLDVIGSGTDAAVVSAAREFFERFGADVRAPVEAGYMNLEDRSDLELDLIEYRMLHPEDTRPTRELVATIIERQRADRDAIAAALTAVEPPAVTPNDIPAVTPTGVTTGEGCSAGSTPRG